MNIQRLHTVLTRFPDLSILVIGDFFLDKYLIIDPALMETSLETGLDVYQVVEQRCSPGAAGTVTNNLRGLGVGSIHALGVIGDDGEGYDLKQGLAATGVETACLIETPDRFTPTYTKPMIRDASGLEREINRIDTKNRHAMPSTIEDRIIGHLHDMISQVDGIIVADQVQERNFGVITDRVRDTIASLAEEHPDTIILVDSRVHIGHFRNCILKPNRHEAAQAIRPDHEGPVDHTLAVACGQALFDRTRRPVYITMSEEGLLLTTADGAEQIPGIPVTSEIDPVGAGDSTSAGITAGFCAGLTYQEAGLIGNLVASVTVQQLGTTGTASPEQVLDSFRDVFGR